MSLKKTKERRKKRRVRGSCSQFFRPDSGQIEKALRPPLITDRCSKSSKGKDHGIFVVFAVQSLRGAFQRDLKERIWPRS